MAKTLKVQTREIYTMSLNVNVKFYIPFRNGQAKELRNVCVYAQVEGWADNCIEGKLEKRQFELKVINVSELQKSSLLVWLLIISLSLEDKEGHIL